jgi:hypothetical protein
MRAGEGIKLVVVEGRRRPGRFGVAELTVGRKLGRCVIGVGGLIEINYVATCAGIGRVVVISIVAGRAVVRYGRMRAV